MGPNEILRHCVLEHEKLMILKEAHVGVAGGHYTGKATVHNILEAVLWWPTMCTDAQNYCHSCDIFQRAGKSSQQDEMSLVPLGRFQAFDKWVVEFVGIINLVGKHTSACYIITMIDYLTIWHEVALVKDCTAATVSNFLFENVVMRIRC